MAIFQDNFTDSNGTALDAHTPDTGDGWTELWSSAFDNIEIQSNQARPETALGDGIIYTADATYPSADYDVECTMVTLASGTDDPMYLLVRIQDQENMYAIRLNEGTGTCQLYKKVTGTWTALGSTFNAPADGSVIKLEIIGTTLKFYDDGSEAASASDSDISSAGKGGIASGGGAELVNSSDDMNAGNLWDSLTITEQAGGAAVVIPTLNLPLMGVG